MANKARVLANAVAELVKAHHEAFMVELLGADAANVSPERLQELLARGLVNPNKLGGVRIKGSKHDIDPFEFLYAVSEVMTNAKQGLGKMRRWSLRQWLPAVDAQIDARIATAVQVGVPLGAVSVGAPPSPPSPPSQSDTGTPPDPEPPLGGAKGHAWKQATGRAGEFCRGLGNEAAGDIEKRLKERWEGEDILQEIDPTKRAETLEIIQQQTAQAIATHMNSGQLARDLADATGNYVHNWKRIAVTEMQGAINEGMVLDAVDAYGASAGIAGVPESGACEHCKRVFLGPDGLPIVYPVHEIVGNGTNVGRRAPDWVATVWPIHPHCRCARQPVPPGFYVTEFGGLRRLKNPGRLGTDQLAG